MSSASFLPWSMLSFKQTNFFFFPLMLTNCCRTADALSRIMWNATASSPRVSYLYFVVSLKESFNIFNRGSHLWRNSNETCGSTAWWFGSDTLVSGMVLLSHFNRVCSREFRSFRSNGSVYSRVAKVRSSLSDNIPE